MDLSKIKAYHLPKKVVLFECENGKFYINEDWVITFNTFREVDDTKVLELHNELSSIESELEHVVDEFTREDLVAQKNHIQNQIQFQLAEDYEQPYSVKVTEAQLPKWIEYAKSAKKDSVWSVAYATGCVFDFGLTSEIVYNPQEFPREWICLKKAA